MKFLLTNDDGYDAVGLTALRDIIEEFGESTLVAPNGEYSGCGHQLTTYSQIATTRKSNGVFAVDGSPADCTRLGLFHFLR